MRLLAFTIDHQPRIGALTDAGVIDLSLVDAAAPTDLGAVIKNGRLAELASHSGRVRWHDSSSAGRSRSAVARGGARKNFMSWSELYGSYCRRPFEKQSFPAIFMRSPTSLVAAHKPILAPSVSNTMDYEAELAVIIGQKCKHLTSDNALDVIAGYSCFNDGSVREYQRIPFNGPWAKILTRQVPLARFWLHQMNYHQPLKA